MIEEIQKEWSKIYSRFIEDFEELKSKTKKDTGLELDWIL